MDWPKAKNILIIILLILDLVLGGLYFAEYKQRELAAKQSYENAIEYAKKNNVIIPDNFPEGTPKLASLRVVIKKGRDEELEYEGTPVVIFGNSKFGVDIESVSESKQQIVSASTVLIKFIAERVAEGDAQGCEIKSIRLVYLVELPSDASSGITATALPAWVLSLDGQDIYYNAYQ